MYSLSRTEKEYIIKVRQVIKSIYTPSLLQYNTLCISNWYHKENQFSGDRNLAEYEILVEDLNITTSQNNHSLALVKVVFRRQGGFHLLTSFVSSKNIKIHQLSTEEMI